MTRVLLLFAMTSLLGCGMFGNAAAKAKPASKPEPPQFMNRVWRVTESSTSAVAVGTHYALLADNTFLVTPPGATQPTLGRWHFAAGGLVLIEEGYRYPADILESSADRFALRIHRPAGVVDVRMVGSHLSFVTVFYAQWKLPSISVSTSRRKE